MTFLPALPGTTIKTYPHVTEAEAQRIWAEAKTPMVRCFIKCLWFTGLRISEVLRLTVRDIRHAGADYSLCITRSKKRQANSELLPVPRELGEALEDYYKGADLKPSSLLFPGHENTYRYEIRLCAKKAHLDNWQKIHPHSFRHGRVYDLASKGTHPYILSKLMGHSSLGITLQYYQPAEADLRQAIEK